MQKSVAVVVERVNVLLLVADARSTILPSSESNEGVRHIIACVSTRSCCRGSAHPCPADVDVWSASKVTDIVAAVLLHHLWMKNLPN